MDARPIYLTRDGEVATMVLNRPAKRNALNREMWEAIPKLCAEVAADASVKVLVLRGATEEAFSGGADIGEFREVHATPESARTYHEGVGLAYDAIVDLDKPTIAMIQGACFGGGCAVTLCCDLRYADHTAKFCIPPARLGLAYPLADTKKLVDLVGPSKAKEMLMGAKVLEAEEALTFGLATRLFESAALESETYAFARELAGLSQYTVRAVKLMVRKIQAGQAKDDAETKGLTMGSFENPDYREGRDAFLEKRKARFTWN